MVGDGYWCLVFSYESLTWFSCGCSAITDTQSFTFVFTMVFFQFTVVMDWKSRNKIVK